MVNVVIGLMYNQLGSVYMFKCKHVQYQYYLIKAILIYGCDYKLRQVQTDPLCEVLANNNNQPQSDPKGETILNASSQCMVILSGHVLQPKVLKFQP